MARSVKRIRSGEFSRGELWPRENITPIYCRALPAMAVYVQTIAGMQWRCDRCGARVKVVA